MELVHGVDDDGWSCEECKQEEQGKVDHHVTHEPGETPHRQIFPIGGGKNHFRNHTASSHKEIHFGDLNTRGSSL